MGGYINSAITAVVLFPLLAAVLTLPFALVQYHRRGAVTFSRVVLVFLFIFYLLAAYFQVILPLPDPAKITGHGIAGHYNLLPFNNLAEYVQKNGFAVTRAWLFGFLKSRTLLQLFFNVLLTFPFGAYLRFYFKCSWRRTVLFSFLLSLFFELTQLSGLYGIYPAPYRLFDADDLICNTLGGALGYLLCPLFSAHLPDREAMDAYARYKSEQVTLFRRICGMVVDLVVAFLTFIPVFAALGELPRYAFLSWMLFLLWLQTVVSRGKTLGKGWCRLRILRPNGKPAGFLRLTVRYLLLWGQLVGTQLAADALNEAAGQRQGAEALAMQALAWLCLAVLALYFAECVLRMFRGGPFLYERLSGTHSVSVFQQEEAPSALEEPVEELAEPK